MRVLQFLNHREQNNFSQQMWESIQANQFSPCYNKKESEITIKMFSNTAVVFSCKSNVGPSGGLTGFKSSCIDNMLCICIRYALCIVILCSNDLMHIANYSQKARKATNFKSSIQECILYISNDPVHHNLLTII